MNKIMVFDFKKVEPLGKDVFVDGKLVYVYSYELAGENKAKEPIWSVKKNIVIDFTNRVDTDEQIRIFASSYRLFHGYKDVIVNGRILTQLFDSKRHKALFRASERGPIYGVNI